MHVIWRTKQCRARRAGVLPKGCSHLPRLRSAAPFFVRDQYWVAIVSAPYCANGGTCIPSGRRRHRPLRSRQQSTTMRAVMQLAVFRLAATSPCCPCPIAGFLIKGPCLYRKGRFSADVARVAGPYWSTDGPLLDLLLLPGEPIGTLNSQRTPLPHHHARGPTCPCRKRPCAAAWSFDVRSRAVFSSNDHLQAAAEEWRILAVRASETSSKPPLSASLCRDWRCSDARQALGYASP